MKVKLLLLPIICLILGACSTNKNVSGVSGDEETENVKVNIEDQNNINVYGKSTYELFVSTNPIGKSIKWTSNDENVATVENATVTFKDVDEIKTVNIRAAYANNESCYDEITFIVHPNVIDYYHSDEIVDFSKINKDGIHFTEEGMQVALNFKAKNFYCEAKFKIKADDGKCGFYLTSGEEMDSNSELLYVDAKEVFKYTGYPYLYHSYGSEKEEVVLPYNHVIQEDTYYTLAISKVDNELYIYGEGDDCLMCYERFSCSSFGDQNVKVGIFSQNADLYVKNISYLLGDDIKSTFVTPTRLYSDELNKTLLVDETYDIVAKASPLNFDRSKIGYVAQDENVIEVSSSGRVLAKSEGVSTVNVSYNTDLSFVMTFVVLEPASTVEIDGVMNDSIYTENVKKHPYKLSKNATNYINFYCSRTYEGAYIFADYYVDTLKNVDGTSWWYVDNWECYFGHTEQIQVIRQFYISKNGCNFDQYYITNAIFDSVTNLYNIKFEVFISFQTLTFDYDDLLTFGPGFNPAAGWAASPARAKQDINVAIAITKDGFAHYDGENWIYDEEEESDYEDLTSTVVVKDATSLSTGTAAMNPTNWTKLVHSATGNFSYTVVFNQKGGSAHDTASDSYLSHVRLYIYDATTAYSGESYSISNNKVTAAFIQSRSDWCIDSYDASGNSSTSDSIYTSKTSGSNYITSVSSDWKTFMKAYFSDVDVTLTITKQGSGITISYKYVGKAEGYTNVFAMTQTLSGLKTNNLGIALCGRKVSFSMIEFYKGTKPSA